MGKPSKFHDPGPVEGAETSRSAHGGIRTTALPGEAWQIDGALRGACTTFHETVYPTLSAT